MIVGEVMMTNRTAQFNEIYEKLEFLDAMMEAVVMALDSHVDANGKRSPIIVKWPTKYDPFSKLGGDV